uniref:Uncharacterized protein n=1 Tax=Arundo donax TaxID=35708 RepID=A0A0A9GA93_ARUDO
MAAGRWGRGRRREWKRGSTWRETAGAGSRRWRRCRSRRRRDGGCSRRTRRRLGSRRRRPWSLVGGGYGRAVEMGIGW